MSTDDRAKAFQRVLRGYDRIISGMKETIEAVEWWNNNRTDEDPFDCEIERVAVAMYEELRAEFVATGKVDEAKYERAFRYVEREFSTTHREEG